ncbi:glycosyltransferase family 4 protein [Devosia chinhatensis]|uniref:Glycosyltransferase subfamily 4-like N-terminal domain-containing protein n=1 Tax=Devosia chinhatensis TaxID=429727 RepID=A0A0F5FLM1_9HYPH|nr:glycosyltransferase family 4 protein [Devosia chinhatensis]KKB09794.1 hypothetical protein VE26_08040 [Devosia chinhatensis]
MSTSFDKRCKIFFHDYGGHAFTAQIARAMAKRGADVLYASFGGFATPKGKVDGESTDPTGFRAEQITISEPFDKDNLLRRQRQQIEYARIAAAKVLAERPDIVFSSNSPLEVQKHLMDACKEVGAKFVFWLQDIHSEAIERIIGKKSALLGRLAGAYYRRLEIKLLKSSDRVIVIADAFKSLLNGWGMDTRSMVVIENWAPLEDIPMLRPDNDWAMKNLRPGRKRIIYSGTLARKHNPDMLLHLARNLDVDVHLFSQGSNADYVQSVAAKEGLDNMIVRPWVAVHDLPSMLASADILYAVIEKDAGHFSVPSKVLSYLAAGRAILASIPQDNLASMNIQRAEAGMVSAPDDLNGLLSNARQMLEDDSLRQRFGANGRAYAETLFDIDAITDRFVDIVQSALGQSRTLTMALPTNPTPSASVL